MHRLQSARRRMRRRAWRPWPRTNRGDRQAHLKGLIAAKPPRFAGSDPFIESDRSGGFGRFADPGRSAEASQSDGSSEPVGVDRPPGSSLARVRVPPPPAVEPDAFPSASPERPWDRVAIVVAREDPRFREESMELKDPLPDRAPDGSSLVGAIVIRTVEVLLGHRPAAVAGSGGLRPTGSARRPGLPHQRQSAAPPGSADPPYTG